VLANYKCEAFLLDAASKDGTFGGTGRTFPWGVAVEAKKYGPVIVAGGLDGSNVDALIRQVDPWGVDACSRLETQPGVKDPEKVRSYLDAAKSVK
jgi:phosphoribosylanthranilate isomerase